MKLFCIITILLLLCIPNSFGQNTSWQWVNPLPQGNILNSVWAISQDTAFAVAEYGTVIRTQNGGRTWQVTTNEAGITEPLYATQFLSSSVGWAVGEGGRILKTTNGGSTWIIQNAGSAVDLFTISFISTSTGWIAGSQGLIYKTTNGGNTWQPESTGITVSFYGSHFLSSTTGWVVGTDGKILSTTDGGNSWTSQTSNTVQNLYSTNFVSPSVGFASGSFGTILKTTNGGANWIPQYTGTDFSLYSIQFLNSLNGFATGAFGMILKTSNGGSTWFEQNSGTYNDLYSLRFTSPYIGWTVGDFGTIVYTTDGGITWQQQSTGVKNILNGINFSSPSIGIAAGEEGTIVRTTNGGSTWTLQPSGVYQTLYGVFMLNDLTGWVVGDSAIILKTINGGLSWTDQNSHTDLTLYSVNFINSSVGWASGDNGTILGTINGGLTWKAETSNTNSSLMRIKFCNERIGWAVGVGGEIVKSSDGGTTWNIQQSNTYQTLYSLDIIDSNTVYAVGDFGTVVYTTDGGTNWAEMNSNSTASLYGITFASGTNGWAAGEDGEIIVTSDGGTNWQTQNSGTLHSLWDIQYVKSNTGGGVLFAAGIGGTIISSAITPLAMRTWTGVFDSVWSLPGNWYPYGLPEKGDSVYIPVTPNQPVFRDVFQQLNVAALRIAAGAKLTLGSGLARLLVNSNIEIDGTLQVENNSQLEIVAGGNFSFGMNGKFIPAKSTVTFNGKGQLRGSFYNLFLAESTKVQSYGNISIKNNLTLLTNLNLRQLDTLTILNPDPLSLQGDGIIGAGTIKRAINPSSNEIYRFESPTTYVHFYPNGTLPDTISMTTYPSTLPGTLSDTMFVRRYYSASAKGGSDFLYFMSLRFDSSESKIPIEDLAIFRDSSGMLYNMGVTDFLDSDMVALSLDSVSRFADWYFGRIEFRPKHRLQYTDTLVVIENSGLSDTLVFGSMPSATDGIDWYWDETPLGPIPPVGTFDARWIIPGTNGTMTDIKDIISYTHLKNEYTCTIQPSAGSYPITLRWNNNVFPTGKITLQDAATHGSQFSVNMRDQNSYVISNPAVTSFEVVHTAPAYYPFAAGWNMISLPLAPFNDNRKINIFPTAVSSAFSYASGYFIAESLSQGTGYWIKFSSAQNVGIDGTPVTEDTLYVEAGWNMIGAISSPVPTNQIIKSPSNLIKSDFFSYNGGYIVSDTLKPCKAYWIKCGSPGTLILNSTTGLNKDLAQPPTIKKLESLNCVTLSDHQGHEQKLYFGDDLSNFQTLDEFELPPTPPYDIFDIRYSTNRMVESISENSGKCMINIHSSNHPLTLKWQIKQPTIKTIAFSNSATGKQLQNPSTQKDGEIQIYDRSLTSISLEVQNSTQIPTEFSLKQNYPNPFNPSTIIEFALPMDANVTLKIYDLLGREVHTIINDEFRKAGTHHLALDANVINQGAAFSSGVYFYRIVAHRDKNIFRDIKKMLLIK